MTDGSPTPGQPTAPSEIDTSVPHSARIWPPIGLGYDHSDTRKSVNNLAAVPREWRNYSYSSTLVSPTSGSDGSRVRLSPAQLDDRCGTHVPHRAVAG